jgi:hypothetical protein
MSETSRQAGMDQDAAWRRFVRLLLSVFFGGVALVAVFILLIDPYNVVAFSLPLDRRIVSINQRHMYPQIARSGRFDSLIIGSSTSRLLDPRLLDKPFEAHFANLAMNAMRAFEQVTMIDLFRRAVGTPKVLIIGLDAVWCDPDADRNRTAYGFPEWMYDDNPWNDYPHLFNTATAEIAIRLIGYKLGLYPERVRFDGYEIFTPPERDYDLARARRALWGDRGPQILPERLPPTLSAEESRTMQFPAVAWLDETLARLPPSSRVILAYMPVHVSAQAWPGTRDAVLEAECKVRIAAVARKHRATEIDWRIPSVLTREDANYWDGLHYRLPIAARIAKELADAAIEGKPSRDGSYRLTPP